MIKEFVNRFKVDNITLFSFSIFFYIFNINFSNEFFSS